MANSDDMSATSEGQQKNMKRSKAGKKGAEAQPTEAKSLGGERSHEENASFDDSL